MKFSGVITIDKSGAHAKGQGQRSKVMVTRDKKSSILTQIGRFRTVTHAWIHRWLWNDAQSWKRCPIDFGIDWPWSSVSFLISNLCFSTKFCISYSFASGCIYLVTPSPANAPHSTGQRTYTDSYMHLGPWNSLVFTRGQFWPLGIVVACVCLSLSVCLSVCLSLACPRDNSGPIQARITKCKRPWLRSLLFCGLIDHDLQGQI